MTDLRRFTMTNPTAAFSIIAHEALDHKATDGEDENDLNDDVMHNGTQRSRRRLRVSYKQISLFQSVFLIHFHFYSIKNKTKQSKNIYLFCFVV